MSESPEEIAARVRAAGSVALLAGEALAAESGIPPAPGTPWLGGVPRLACGNPRARPVQAHLRRS